MPKGTTFDSDFLKLIYNATAITNLADNAGTSPLTNLYASLHTADPSGGDQTTSEVSYTGYARVAVARTTGGFAVTGNAASPVAAVVFGQRTDNAAAVVATWFAVGTAPTGTGKVLHSGQLGASQKPFTAAVSGNTFTCPAHGYGVNQEVFLEPGIGGTLPGGYTAGTPYYVITAATDTFTLSATRGGAAVTVTGSGNGAVATYSPLTIAQNTIPQLTTSTTITEY